MNKDLIKVIAKGSLQVGKKVLLEGSQLVALGAVGVLIRKTFAEGVSGLKHTTLDELLNVKEEPKKVKVAKNTDDDLVTVEYITEEDEEA